ncbi:uncharacterized protein EI90DRAFT_3034007 [Cantharellus anzutake]|uniref:uncharacterized protein n=1 Tax=Cantharellus anzutake TaxID=1750568 RepID=UPI0019032410|nr:uncharacterized protein EI90DRAFT_3034007 [Cantharellus anzutake]KAF8341453.1 hypothetical protein EI90DRAFT_3034007 [Cantharellus anzutake]
MKDSEGNNVELSLTNNALAQDLMQHVKEQADLRPLVAFLDAARAPELDHSESVQKAAETIKMHNMMHHVPKPTKLPAAIPHPHVLEGDGKPALVFESLPFQNWGQTVSNTPSTIWVIRTIAGVKNLVKFASSQRKRVRVAGFRHTWANLFGADGDIIVVFLPLATTTTLPYQPPTPEWLKTSELVGIHGPIGSIGNRLPGKGHSFYQVMAGTTNDYFRRWCFSNKKVCIPFNVIMVEVTFGGTNGPICHGSGLGSTTLSDLVVEIRYVDAHGEEQIVNDPDELRAASGCFGLLGIVTSVTLQLDDISIQEQVKEAGITEAQIETARQKFIERCETDYYLEWFWFPYQEHCWVNTWQKRPFQSEDASIKTYPDDNFFTGASSQQVQETIAELITSWKHWAEVSGYHQAYWFGLATMATLPNVTDGKPIETLLSDALHFRRGIQNFRCLDSEWEIPVPPQKDGSTKRDYGLIQTAWWDAISAIYKAGEKAPVRVAVELRLTGGSEVLLAPQRGNATTCSIEVLTTLTTPQNDWDDFKQEIADIWTSYKGPDGQFLKSRPHWAKQWEGLKVHNQPIETYLKDVYQDSFKTFRTVFEEILKRRNSSIEEVRARFGNDTLYRLIFE